MSVVKGKRNRSKIEFERIYARLADRIDTLIENRFFVDPEQLERNAHFIQHRSDTLSNLVDTLLFYIKIANSIYPTCQEEYEERRIAMDKAIGTTYAILACFQRIIIRLRIPDDKYTEDVKNIGLMVNSLKAWRKSDNRFRKENN